MGALMFFLQAASPSPTPTSGLSASNWTSILAIITSVISGITGIVANPWLAIGALGVTAIGIVALYLFIKGKITTAENNAAQNDTNTGYDNQVDNRIPVNQQDNQADNDDRNKIDQMK